MAIRDLILSDDPEKAIQELRMQWTEMAGVVNDVLNHLTVDRAGLLTSDAIKTINIETTGNPPRGAAAPAQTYLNNTSGWKFAVGDEVYFNIILPPDWKPGTGISFDVHFYSSNTTASRYIRWQLDWQSIAIGEVISAPGSSGSIDSGDVLLSTTANTFSVTAFTNIAGTSISSGDHLMFKMSRIASTGTAPAAGDNPVVLHFEVDYTAYVTAP